MENDVLLGRQFFAETKLKLIYQNGKYVFEDALSHIKDLNTILSLYAVNETNTVYCRTKFEE